MTDSSPAAPDGPFRVVRHWSRWSIETVLDDRREQPVFATEAEAAAEAERRNLAYSAPRRRRPVQATLFEGPAGDAV